MKSELSSICYYATEKVSLSNINKHSYVSTENLLPNRGGLLEATALPAISKTQSYDKGDILVSNIRPYFKKIWYAKNAGGCSNDVLVFRAKEGTDPRFLYYVLADDAFFAYSMATSKGTKMPRGDKVAIMKYPIVTFDLKTQKKIAGLLGSIDSKIEFNNKINKNLEQQVKLIYQSWLVEYAPFGRSLPKGWAKIQLSDIAEFISGYSYKGKELIDSDIAMASIKNFERCGGFKLDGYKEIVPSSKLKDSQYAELFDVLVAHTDITQNADVIGNAELIVSKSGYQKIIFSMDLVKVIPKISEISTFLLAAMLQNSCFKEHCLGYVNGTTVLHLSKKALPDYSLQLPKDLSVLGPLNNILSVLYEQIALNIDENEHLERLRDALLPKLMTGELDVSNIDI